MNASSTRAAYRGLPLCAAIAIGMGLAGSASLSAQTRIADDAALPPNAKAGECYARVFAPAEYETASEQLVVQDAATVLDVTAPEYETVTEEVVVEEASFTLEVIPAQYEVVEEQVLVKEASEELVAIPAEYQDVEEEVVVRAAYTTWKKGRGLIERVDDSTGEIMCLVEVPAETNTVKKRVLVSPARVDTVQLPAEYRTVKKRVMVEPPRTERIEIPAKTETVTVARLARPAQQLTTEIPAEYRTVESVRKVADGYMAWRPVLCETNAKPGLIADIQRSLANLGHYGGTIDGVNGRGTESAIAKFQRKEGLATGGLTMETIQKLGIDL